MAGICPTAPDGAAPLRHGPEDRLEVDLVVVAALRCIRSALTWPASRRIGIESAQASATPGERIGRPRAGRGADDPRLPVTRRIAVGHECPGLLVADEDRGDRSRRAERVVDRRRVRAGHAEDVPDAVSVQLLEQYDPRRYWP